MRDWKSDVPMTLGEEVAHKLAESRRHASIMKLICAHFGNVGHVNSVDGHWRGRSLVARGRAQCVCVCVFFSLAAKATDSGSRLRLKCTTTSVLQDQRPFVLDHGLVRSPVSRRCRHRRKSQTLVCNLSELHHVFEVNMLFLRLWMPHATTVTWLDVFSHIPSACL